MKTIYVKLGELGVSKEPAVIKTVLGSCISVCVYDSRLKCGGLCHFNLPERSDAGLNGTTH